MFQIFSSDNATYLYPVRPRTMWNTGPTTIISTASFQAVLRFVRWRFRHISLSLQDSKLMYVVMTLRLSLLSNSEWRICCHFVVPQTEPPNIWDVLKQCLQSGVWGPKLRCTANNFIANEISYQCYCYPFTVIPPLICKTTRVLHKNGEKFW